MNALVIIPITMHNYSFSAPLAWLFSKHKDKVKGVFAFELTENLIDEYDLFIVELNWFIQLYEFTLVVNAIKRVKPNAGILFGGLYSAIKYEELFKRLPVDYCIQGDNELPIDLLLRGCPEKEVPNLVTKNGKNKDTYIFQQCDFDNFIIDIDWIPSYLKYSQNPEIYYREDDHYERLMLTLYSLPMVITTKGGCPSKHHGCDYCMGSKESVLFEIYRRPPVSMTNSQMHRIIDNIQKKYRQASLFFLTDNNYDFSGYYYDLEVSMEIDAKMSCDTIKGIVQAFPKCIANISVYEEGVFGSTPRKDIEGLLEIEDANHRINFLGDGNDPVFKQIPKERKLFPDDTFPKWAYWDFYNNYDSALRFSKRIFYHNVNVSRKFPLT
jgi:hypothetical protein